MCEALPPTLMKFQRCLSTLLSCYTVFDRHPGLWPVAACTGWRIPDTVFYRHPGLWPVAASTGWRIPGLSIPKPWLKCSK